TLTVNNVAPTATITGAPASGHSPEGTAITLGSSVTDPSSADTIAGFTYAWNVTKSGVDFASWNAADFSFTPDDNATYVVTLTAPDKDGSAGTTSTTITVDNVAPTITDFTVPAGGTEASAVALSAAATDPAGAADPLTFTWTITRPDATTVTLSGADATF